MRLIVQLLLCCLAVSALPAPRVKSEQPNPDEYTVSKEGTAPEMMAHQRRMRDVDWDFSERLREEEGEEERDSDEDMIGELQRGAEMQTTDDTGEDEEGEMETQRGLARGGVGGKASMLSTVAKDEASGLRGATADRLSMPDTMGIEAEYDVPGLREATPGNGLYFPRPPVGGDVDVDDEFPGLRGAEADKETFETPELDMEVPRLRGADVEDEDPDLRGTEVGKETLRTPGSWDEDPSLRGAGVDKEPFRLPGVRGAEVDNFVEVAGLIKSFLDGDSSEEAAEGESEESAEQLIAGRWSDGGKEDGNDNSEEDLDQSSERGNGGPWSDGGKEDGDDNDDEETVSDKNKQS